MRLRPGYIILLHFRILLLKLVIDLSQANYLATGLPTLPFWKGHYDDNRLNRE